MSGSPSSWTLTESRWEFEDSSYVPVRGLSVLHGEGGVWKLIAGVAAAAISNELLRPGSPVAQPARASAWPARPYLGVGSFR